MRKFNWDNNLVRFSEEKRGVGYEWGETDCASLVIDAVNEMYEDDPFDNSPNWTTEIGAKRALSKVDIEEELHKAGAEVVDKNFERSGDIVVGFRENDEWPGVGIVVDCEHILTSHEDRGVHVVDKQSIDYNKVYRI